MKKSVLLFALIFLLLSTLGICGSNRGRDLNMPPPREVREMVRRAVLLAEADQPEAAVRVLRKAIDRAPNYLRAHVEYKYIKTSFLNQRDDVDAEYASLISRHPDNPVYLMAGNGSDAQAGSQSLEKVAAIAPEWAWSHYAKALLTKDREPEKAAAELQLCIGKDSSAREAYYLLIELQEKRLNRIDDAIRTAEQLAAQADIRPSQRLAQLWRLRLVKGRQSERARQDLRNELSQLANASRDVDVLFSIRSAYLDLVKDPEAAKDVEAKLLQVDPTWNVNRSWLYRLAVTNQSGVPRLVVLAGHQITIHQKMVEIADAADLDPAEKIRRLGELLSMSPNPVLRRIIHERAFRIAVTSRDAEAALRYGEALKEVDPDDHALLAQMALVLADEKRNLSKSLLYARKAEAATSEFRLAKRPPNSPQWFLEQVFPEEKQREAYRRHRALALDALGWVLVQMDRASEGEPLLRRAVEVERSERRLSHLANALRRVRRIEEADKAESEARAFLADSLKARFLTEEAPDAQLESIDGRKFRLSELKGRVVVINFWATWCVPCVREMPALKRLYEKYRTRGLEILAISTDEEPGKVAPFVARSNLSFPIFNDRNLSKLFKVGPIPTNIFIDREGKVRYRKIGFDEESEPQLDAVISLLLK